MGWVYYNPNPKYKHTGDCAVRAIAKAFDVSWDTAKAYIDVYSMDEAEVETSDLVWGKILSLHGFKMKAMYCAECRHTLNDFCKQHKKGVYVLKLPEHVVCVVDGDYYDTLPSLGNEVPLYYWERG